MSICRTDTSVCHTARQSVCPSTSMSVALSVHTMASPSVISIHLSYDPSVHPPVTSSMTRQSTTPPVSPVICLSDRPSWSNHLYTILTRLSGCPTLSDCTSPIYTSPSDCPSPSNCTTHHCVCQYVLHHLTVSLPL